MIDAWREEVQNNADDFFIRKSSFVCQTLEASKYTITTKNREKYKGKTEKECVPLNHDARFELVEFVDPLIMKVSVKNSWGGIEHKDVYIPVIFAHMFRGDSEIMSKLRPLTKEEISERLDVYGAFMALMNISGAPLEKEEFIQNHQNISYLPKGGFICESPVHLKLQIGEIFKPDDKDKLLSRVFCPETKNDIRFRLVKFIDYKIMAVYLVGSDGRPISDDVFYIDSMFVEPQPPGFTDSSEK